MKLKRGRFKYILIAGIVGPISYSCKTSNMISVEPKEHIKVNAVVRHYKKRVENVEGIWVKKVNGTLRDETDSPKFFKANYRIKRDSAILISVSNAIGMEGLRVLFTPDSVGLIDRINKTYYWDDYEGLKRRFGSILHFKDMQAILLNEIVFAEKDRTVIAENGSRRVDIINGRYRFGLQRNDDDESSGCVMYKRYIELEASKLNMLRSIITFEDENSQIEVNYSNFREIDGIYFPTEISFRMDAEKGILDCSVTMDRIYIGNDIDISFKVSNRYERIGW